jgi:ABC-type Fe3+-siderophore transport system permease subunit
VNKKEINELFSKENMFFCLMIGLFSGILISISNIFVETINNPYNKIILLLIYVIISLFILYVIIFYEKK